MQFINRILLILGCIAACHSYVLALTLPLPESGSDITGENFMVHADSSDFVSIAARYQVGVHDLLEANPHVNPERLREGEPLLIPRQFILPQPRKGIVINLAELRLYYFSNSEKVVMTYPIGIGRVGWNTPTGATRIVQKVKDPVWRPTKAIRESALQDRGVQLPEEVAAGPENPLGPYALRLGFNEYLIHGTNTPEGVGLRVSSGCIRMYNEDIDELFHAVKVGTPVTIINKPDKVGWDHGAIYVESQQPLSDDEYSQTQGSFAAVTAVHEKVGDHAGVDWQAVRRVGTSRMGIPQKVSH